MKVMWSPSGEIVVEADTVKEAVELAKALRNNGKPVRIPADSFYSVADVKAKEHVEKTPLPRTQQEVWEWLVANDTPRGRTPTEINVAFGIHPAAMNARIRKLREAHAIRRVSRGHYRAGDR